MPISRRPSGRQRPPHSERCLRAVELGNCVDDDARVGAPRGGKAGRDVVFEEIAFQVGFRMLDGIEAVQHLDVLVADEQVFG